jgi:hypothetical protein
MKIRRDMAAQALSSAPKEWLLRQVRRFISCHSYLTPSGFRCSGDEVVGRSGTLSGFGEVEMSRMAEWSENRMENRIGEGTNSWPSPLFADQPSPEGER